MNIYCIDIHINDPNPVDCHGGSYLFLSKEKRDIKFKELQKDEDESRHFETADRKTED